jgi:hypothetical protein
MVGVGALFEAALFRLCYNANHAQEWFITFCLMVGTVVIVAAFFAMDFAL